MSYMRNKNLRIAFNKRLMFFLHLSGLKEYIQVLDKHFNGLHGYFKVWGFFFVRHLDFYL